MICSEPQKGQGCELSSGRIDILAPHAPQLTWLSCTDQFPEPSRCAISRRVSASEAFLNINNSTLLQYSHTNPDISGSKRCLPPQYWHVKTIKSAVPCSRMVCLCFSRSSNACAMNRFGSISSAFSRHCWCCVTVFEADANHNQTRGLSGLIFAATLRYSKASAGRPVRTAIMPRPRNS